MFVRLQTETSMAPQKKRKTDGSEEVLPKRGAVNPDQVASLNLTIPEDAAPFFDVSKLTEVEKILRVDVWSEDPEKVAVALEALSVLCYDENCKHNDLQRKKAGEAGAGSIIPVIMRKWSKNEDVQAAGCWTFVCCPSPAGREKDCLIVKHARTCGILDAVIWAMKAYPLNDHIQYNAIGALYELCDGVGLNASFVVKDMKILPSIIGAYDRYNDDARLINGTSRLLNSLSAFSEIQDDMIDAGCISILDEIIHFYKHNSDFDSSEENKLAKEALANLCKSFVR